MRFSGQYKVTKMCPKYLLTVIRIVSVPNTDKNRTG